MMEQAFKLRRAIYTFWLFLRVHCDALRLAPTAYLTATKWRILGKRVRARGQFAPLLGQSSKAYELWAILDERRGTPASCNQKSHKPILALILDHGDRNQLDVSIKSLQEQGLQFLVIPETGDPHIREALGAIDRQDTQWFMPISAGDQIAPGSALTYCAQIAKPTSTCSVIYSDDDRIDRWGHRSRPHFKPNWNPDLHKHHDFVTGACILRADRDSLFEVGSKPGWASNLTARALASGDMVAHIAKILHHRRTRGEPRLPLSAPVIAENCPRVSVIIPTRNGTDLLRTCITGLRATDYPDLEIIIVDNGSDDPGTLTYLQSLAEEGVIVLPQPGPFNYSALNNRAVEVASGDLICLLNNDIEMLSPDWLAIMVTQALRPDVGAVGAQLLYPDGRIQHAGVVIGVGNAAGHAHRFVYPEDEGYFRRHALPQFITAVTAACLVVQKDRFLAVGGLDEANFPVAFNDVDLCLRLNQQGWQSFYEPRAVLVHHESVSRGDDRDPVGAARFAGEMAALQRIWHTDEITDPFHHPNLSRASEQFTMALL